VRQFKLVASGAHINEPVVLFVRRMRRSAPLGHLTVEPSAQGGPGDDDRPQEGGIVSLDQEVRTAQAPDAALGVALLDPLLFRIGVLAADGVGGDALLGQQVRDSLRGLHARDEQDEASPVSQVLLGPDRDAVDLGADLLGKIGFREVSSRGTQSREIHPRRDDLHDGLHDRRHRDGVR
jgi:hypothetical protein